MTFSTDISESSDSPFDLLPRDMLHEILRWLEFPEWQSMRYTCKRFHAACQTLMADLDLYSEHITLRVPSPFAYELAGERNTDALFALAMYYFLCNTELSIPLWVAYFEQTDAIYEDRGLIILDAAYLYVEDQRDAVPHCFKTIAYIHKDVCFHLRVGLYPLCQCCRENCDERIRDRTLRQIRDRIDRYYGLYNTTGANSFFIVEDNCYSPRFPLDQEFSISSSISGSLLPKVRLNAPSFGVLVEYPPVDQREKIAPYESTYALLLQWKDSIGLANTTISDSDSCGSCDSFG